MQWKIDGEHLIFSCGCKFPIIEKLENKFPKIKVDENNLPNCNEVWKMMAEGKTKGIFQLETNLGKSWSQKVRPESIEHLSALGAILRPGTLEAKDEHGISMTEHYALRKNGLEPIEKINPILDKILEKTYGIIVYQESMIKIAIEIAGFSPVEADNLRKACGKKDQAEMSKLEKRFVDGCESKGIVSKEMGQKIFDNIRKSARYSFNACITPDTLVEKENGDFITIEDLKIGEIIKSPFGNTKVVNKYENGEKDVVEIILESGKSIKCTLDHEFLCEDKEKRPLYEILEKNFKIITDD